MTIESKRQKYRCTLVWCLFLLIILFFETTSAMNVKQFSPQSQQYLNVWAGGQVFDQPNGVPNSDIIVVKVNGSDRF